VEGGGGQRDRRKLGGGERRGKAEWEGRRDCRRGRAAHELVGALALARVAHRGEAVDLVEEDDGRLHARTHARTHAHAYAHTRQVSTLLSLMDGCTRRG
jgi:hypothetical protein